MKFKSLFFLFLSVIVATGCKKESDNTTKEEGVKPATEEVVANTFKFTVNAVVKKDDDFCLLFTEDGSLNFNDKAVWKGVKGSENEQAIEFVLPNEAFPTQLRLDLGMGSDQDDITIKSIKMEYGKNVRELKGAEMGIFFRADASKCTFDPVTGVVKALVKDGKKQNSSLYPNEAVLTAELPKLAN